MYSSISIPEVKKLIGMINIIDIRDSYMYNLGNIPTSRNIPINFLLMNKDRYLDKNKKYYIYCEKGFKSIKACNELSKEGYNVVNIEGGYSSYKDNF